MSDVDKGVVAELFKRIGMPTNPLCSRRNIRRYNC